MEDNEDEPADVRYATPVQDAILQGNEDEKNVNKEYDRLVLRNDYSSRRRVKSAASSRRKFVETKLKNKSCINEVKFPRAKKIRKPCHEKMEIVCRDNLTKEEYLNVLSAAKKTDGRSERRRMKTEPRIYRRGKSGYANCTSHRIEELAKPTKARTMRLLEDWGSRLRPEMIDTIVESLQENCAMSPEQMAAYWSDKKRQRNQMRRRKRKQKCPGKDKKKRSCDDNLDKEAVCQEYAMARRFTRHIVAHANNGRLSSAEHYDLTEAILQQLVDHLDYKPSGDSERSFQMMLVLANGIADWIHGLNLTVAEKLDNDRSSRELEDTDSAEWPEDETGGLQNLEQSFVDSDDSSEEDDEGDEDDEEATREAEQTTDEEVDEDDEEATREAEQTRDDGREDANEASDRVPRGTDEASGTHPDQVDARTQSDKEQGVNTDGTGGASDDAVVVTRASGQDETTGTEEDVGQDAEAVESEELDVPEEDPREVESDEPEEPRTTSEEDEVDEIVELDEDDAVELQDEEVDRDISVLSVMEQIDATGKLPDGDGISSDIPFVTLGKILEIGVKNLKKFEAAETNDVRRRLQNTIFKRLTNLVRLEDADALNDNMKAVLEILAENVAVFVEDALPSSRINEIRNMDPQVESTDIRNWGQWLDNVMDNASMWSNWIHETVMEAREKARTKVTRADWQQWTSDVETEALRWRLFNLDTKHRMHHADLNLTHKRVVHRRESATADIRSRSSSLPPSVASEEAELETHDLSAERADRPELLSGTEENELRYSTEE